MREFEDINAMNIPYEHYARWSGLTRKELENELDKINDKIDRLHNVNQQFYKNILVVREHLNYYMDTH